MKNLWIILVLGLIVPGVFGTEPDIGGWFRPALATRADYVFANDVENQGPDGLGDNEVAQSDFMLFNMKAGALLWKWAWFEIDLNTYNGLPEDGTPYTGLFSIYQSDWGFKAGIQHWGVRLGYEHWCFHPVLSGDFSFIRVGGYNVWYLEYDLVQMMMDMPSMRYIDDEADFVRFDVKAKLGFIPWYHSETLNIENYVQDVQYIENIMTLSSTVGFTLWDILWMHMGLGLYLWEDDFQVDLVVGAGISFRGLKVGYTYKMYSPTSDMVPIMGWYGNTQSIYVGFDLSDIYRHSM